MKSLRAKFIAIFLLVTLLPLLPLACLAEFFLEKTIGIVLQKPLAEGLSGALELVSEQMNAESRALAARMQSVKNFMQNKKTKYWEGEMQSSTALSDSIRFAIVDASGVTLKSWPQSAAIKFEKSILQNALPADSLVNAGTDSAAVRLALRLRREVQPAEWLIGEKAISEKTRQRFKAIVSAAQMRQYLELNESELRQSLLLAFLALYAPMLLFSLAAGWYLAHRITAPLAELSIGVQQLAAGKWEHRVAIRSQDEIGQVGSAFNSMVENLRRQQEQVIGLEKMAAWREIARVLAHEIKNPLTPMQLMVRQIQDEYKGQDENYRQTLAEGCRIIDEEIEQLRQLVREFSDFARMPELHPTPGQLNELATEVAKLYSQRPVELQLDPALPQFNFDWEAMRRVLINLIENAMQASATAKIVLRTFHSPNRVVIAVEDTGPGIAPENLARIFEPYFSTKKSGIGLGLAIVKRIVEEHGGTISVQSEVGRGSKFVCKFHSDS
ncbi:MAG: HAMP domain-containing histidine kinase [candidate division KSB1 bacterium]|nr:HAMP domain-containing histidine kinase [candidate division KSB1 bacterium]MDZ7367032.1 HAMP domain-containing histidine kinase [candidate division KSB1 bacterium]MDZ7406732.1 HAMP domain-containing histidine kinase [candidate division KSB1 bacterium]